MLLQNSMWTWKDILRRWFEPFPGRHKPSVAARLSLDRIRRRLWSRWAWYSERSEGLCSSKLASTNSMNREIGIQPEQNGSIFADKKITLNGQNLLWVHTGSCSIKMHEERLHSCSSFWFTCRFALSWLAILVLCYNFLQEVTNMQQTK